MANSLDFQSPCGRREALRRLGCGFGWLALAGLAGQRVAADTSSPRNPLARKQPHLPAKAKRVIFLFMHGGISQVDAFDYKPELKRLDGQLMDFDDARTLAKTGKRSPQCVMKPLWDFSQHGESGQWISELFPEMARFADDVCFVRSMHTEGVAHGPATLFLHTGTTNFIRPSMGAWVSYGLGTENQNLPGFVSISPALGNGGPRNYGNAFLPPVYQGTALGRAGLPAAETAFRNIVPPQGAAAEQQFALMRDLNSIQSRARGSDPALDAVLQSYELAWRMQSAAPSVVNLERESAAIHSLYGIGDPTTDEFGRQCLMARQLSEAGVRFIEVNYTDNTNNPRWDQHTNMLNHLKHARAVDKPVAGLLADLKARGLLEDTLVWFGSEFGRTPYAQRGGTGRDHNPEGFTHWLAGAGVKRGISHGETDELGHHSVTNRVHMHDMHATVLHLLGLDHEQLTFRHSGRDFRLTDVAGRVVRDILT
jgi:hypothetical protein